MNARNRASTADENAMPDRIGARVIEHLPRIRVHLPTSCPDGALFRTVAFGLMPSGP